VQYTCTGILKLGFSTDSNAMPRIAGKHSVQYKSKKDKTFVFSLNPGYDLPPEVCKQWERRSFVCLPAELAAFRHPTSKSMARNGADALIEYLKKETAKGTVNKHFGALPIGEWLIRFTTFENNPRAQRLISEGTPYSPSTVEELYFYYYNRYIAGDAILTADINTFDVTSCRAWLARIGMKKCKQGRIIAGRRVYEVIVGFIRMAFTEYWEDRREWRNPFDQIDPPKRIKGKKRDVLEEDEIIKLFMPGVITDPLERGVAIAMYWAGLRRAEIFGLKTHEDLVWGNRGKLKIINAWKRFGSKKKRTLGDPKWHKIREAPFPDDLQGAVKVLQAAHGIHEFVFCFKDGSIPHGKWIQEKLPGWLKRAGIDLGGRKIVPHSARHSLASTLEAAGVPLRYIRDMLGHSSMETTLGYLHTPQGMINQITKKIGERAKEDPKSAVVPFNGEAVG